MKELFVFEGAVYVFGKIAAARWTASTWASSVAKAQANLKYRFRAMNNLRREVPIRLDGALIQQRGA